MRRWLILSRVTLPISLQNITVPIPLLYHDIFARFHPTLPGRSQEVTKEDRLHIEVGGDCIPPFTEELLRGLPSLRTLS
jgi:hypothetical protein